MSFQRIVIIAVLLCGAGVSQNPPGSKAPDGPEKTPSKETISEQHWLELANRLTSEVEHDATQLSANNEAVALAQLSRLWWDADRARSRQFLDRAIEQVTRTPDRETGDQQDERIRCGSAILQIAVPMVSSEEAKRISSALTRDVSDPQESYMAKMREQEAFATAVHSEIDHDNVTHAAEMMVQGLKDGKSMPNLGILRRKDSAAADRVFRETLKVLPEINYDPRTIIRLMQDAYPVGTVKDVKSAPAELQKAFLQTMAEAILHAPANEADKQNQCMNAQYALMHLSDKFVPQQLTAMQAVMDDSLPKSGNTRPSVGFKPHIDCFRLGAQECLRLADVESNPSESTDLRIFAIVAAEAEKNSALAISIYKSLPEEERRRHPDIIWDLEDSYLELGHWYLKNKDQAAFHATLSAAPDELRLYLQLSFVEEILDKGNTIDGLALLAEARSAARNGTYNPIEYLQVLDLYVRFLPDNADAVMAELVNGINRVSYPKDESETRKLLLSAMILPWIFPGKLLDRDPSFLSASADSLQVPEWRTCFRLGLLRSTLLRYKEALTAAHKTAEQESGAAN